MNRTTKQDRQDTTTSTRRSTCQAMTPDHPRWHLFVAYLIGPDGLDCTDDGMRCSGTYDYTRHVLRRFEDISAELTCEFFLNNGAKCDCEVLMNVVDNDQHPLTPTNIRSSAAIRRAFWLQGAVPAMERVLAKAEKDPSVVRASWLPTVEAWHNACAEMFQVTTPLLHLMGTCNGQREENDT